MLTTEERTARLTETLKRLRLPTVRACYEEQAGPARGTQLRALPTRTHRARV